MAKMISTKEDGQLESLERRLERLADERPVVIGRIIYELIERINLEDEILRDCGALDSDEWTGEHRD